MARIVVVGSGVVGTATGRGLDQAGHDVTFVDVLPERVRQLRSDGFDAHMNLSLSDTPAFIFLTLPTPHAGKHYDLVMLADGVAAVGRAIAHSSARHTIVVRSTVPPGTTEGMVQPIIESESGKVLGRDFELACNPEFLRAATADHDFRNPWMTVIASRSAGTRERLADLLAPFGGHTRSLDNPATAELVKCAHNIFNATKISFWNEMWLVASRLGINLEEVSGIVALSAEGSINPQYGIRGGAPYGGACLPKDTKGFLGFAVDHGLAMPLLEAVIDVNERLHALQAGLVDDAVGTTEQQRQALRPGRRIRDEEAALSVAVSRQGD
jgi:UDPglucose 6-dehydrogenase